MRHPAPVILAALTLAACSAERAGPEPAAPVQAAAPSPFAGELDARGTEPFWALKIRANGLTLSRPDAADASAPNPGMVEANDGAVWTTTLQGEPLIVTVTDAGDCSDGMSDLRYPFEVQVVLGSQTLRGCAFRAGEPPAGPPP